MQGRVQRIFGASCHLAGCCLVVVGKHRPEDHNHVSGIALKLQLLFDIRAVGGRELAWGVRFIGAVMAWSETGNDAM